MSERTISVPIDCEDKTCGECEKYYSTPGPDQLLCHEFGVKLEVIYIGNRFVYMRLEECIKAEFASLPFEKQYAIIIAKYKAEHKHIPAISFSGELPSPSEKIILEKP